MLATLLLALVATAAGLHVGGIAAVPTPRHSTPCMKGKGTRGMPGKAMKGPPTGGTGVKQRLQKKDFEQRKEWQLVLEDQSELGEQVGATKAVSAGVTPQGQEYIWCLVRGKKVPEGEDPEVFAVDGSCRICQFPMLKAEVDAEVNTITCGCCGTKWSLRGRGEVIDFLPGSNPVQWVAKKANEAKGPKELGMLPTRVSKANRVYLRLPDGTLLNNVPEA